jgi:pimeloyl-ACP methyl ester carboxylesterase
MGLASLLLTLLASSPGLSFAKAIIPIVSSYQYDVTIASKSLTDHDRSDPYANDGRPRSIMVSSFYPVTQCRRKKIEPYMPPAIASFMDTKFGAYGLPNGSFQSLEIETCMTPVKRDACSSGFLPVVLFSGALATSRHLYNAMLQNIAAAGYAVLSIDHPYDADMVEFPDGTIVTGVDIDSDAEIELALNTRVADIEFVSEQMYNASVSKELFPGNMPGQSVFKMAVVGHSLGGATAASAMTKMTSLEGGINLDGSMFGSVLTTGFDKPFMLMGHENKTQGTDPSWMTIWPRLTGWKKELEVKNTAHYSFSDLPLVISALGLDGKLPAEVGELLGSIEGRRMTNLTTNYVATFLSMVLKDGKEGAFSTAGRRFPEVSEVA